MNIKFTFTQFLKRFPNDDACLDEIMNLRYPAGVSCPVCNKVTKYYKLKKRTSYSCEFCRTQIYPLSGTIFEKTTTSLRLWFYAMFLMTQTRAGISAKQLERELGVTYKTAWRMFKQIRILMAQNSGDLLSGTVEIDETYIGGKGKNRAHKWTQGIEGEEKQIVMGMVQRLNGGKGGVKAYIKHIPNTGKWTLLKQIQENISPKSRVITDEWGGYKQLIKYGYTHDSVNHKKKEFVRGDVYTQNIENVWSHLKRGIYGVYRIVSKKYLQAYVDEYTWRYNNRKYTGTMFDRLFQLVAEVRILKA